MNHKAIGGVAGLALAAALLVASPPPQAAASPVYTTMYDVSSEQGLHAELTETNFGVSRTAYFVVTGKNGANVETNWASASALQSSSIVDKDDISGLTLRIVVVNTTSSAVALDSSEWWMPTYEGRSSGGGAVATPPSQMPSLSSSAGSTPTPTLQVRAAGSTGYQSIDDFTAAGGTAADIAAVRLFGTLAAQEVVTVDVPLSIDGTAIRSTYNPYSWLEVNEIRAPRLRPLAGNQKVRVRLRFAERMTDAAGGDALESTGQIVGGVRDRSNDAPGSPNTSRFTAVPADIQALLPNQSIDDIDYVSNDDNFTSVPAAEDPRLFTGGLYHVRLDRVKTALAGTGWSVNNVGYNGRFDTDPDASRLADVYGYGPVGVTAGAAVEDPSTGDPIEMGTDGRGTVHVELYQYIEAHDLSLRVGDSYSVADTLDWIRTYAGVTLADGSTTGLDELVNGASVGSGNLAHVEVDSDVDTSAAGVYHVTYRITFDDGESVYKTVTVTVVGSGDEEPSDDDRDPALPIAPDDSTTPAAPTTPEGAAAAGNAGSRKKKGSRRALPKTGDAALAVTLGLAGASVAAIALSARRRWAGR